MEQEKLQSIKDRCKWRGKSIPYNVWKYGQLKIDEYNNAYLHYCIDSRNIPISNKVDIDTIGKYTGYKEIYEGDIVKAPYLDPVFKDPIEGNYVYAVIEFRYGAFVVTYDEGTHIYLDDLAEKIEVVGNIYDNPEFMK